MEREQAIRLVQQLLTLLKQKNGSDLFITAGFPPAIKVDGHLTPVMDKPVSPENAALIVRGLMADRQIKEFEATNECQFAISPPGIGRFRVSAFVQQGCVGAVLRTINTSIPTFEELGYGSDLVYYMQRSVIAPSPSIATTVVASRATSAGACEARAIQRWASAS